MNDVLHAAGPQAAHIAELWRLTVALCEIVFVLVMAALAWAVWRAPKAKARTRPATHPEPALEKKVARSVTAAVTVCALGLIALLIASVMTDRALAHLALDDALAVHITAHQWWWEITYDDPSPNRTFTTANELRIPVGRPIVATLDADDVIHSFWVPNLHGKKDLVPGRTATIWLRADRPGAYIGRCAEYCGLQHAFMAMDVIALEPDRFASWAEAQRAPAVEPKDAAARRGRELFASGSCMMCHAIQGTPANARKAPDLTHFASRTHLAAGRLPNTSQHLTAWIMNPQSIKPGVNMPAQRLASADLKALVAYLETLQ